MDNIAPQASDNSPCVIHLSHTEFHYYQTQCLHIKSPAGDYLESIGHNVQQDILQTNVCRLCDQVALVDALLSNIDKDVNFSKQAVLGLAGLMDGLMVSFKR